MFLIQVLKSVNCQNVIRSNRSFSFFAFQTSYKNGNVQSSRFPRKLCCGVLNSCFGRHRLHSSQPPEFKQQYNERPRTILNYLLALFVGVLGMGFAAVPLYETFCQKTNFGGRVEQNVEAKGTRNMRKVPDRWLTIVFNADNAATLQWNFKPLQKEIKVVPGETVLAFYSAENPTDKPISGISTYNVVPFEVGQYFNKIQCFCFDEQRLNPHEQVDMPVFFYIDPEFVNDPEMVGVDVITLSYTFFEAREGLSLPFIPKHPV